MRARDETLPGMRASTPVIIYHITYDDGEKVPPNPIALASALTLTLTHPSMPCLGLSSTLYGTRYLLRWPRTFARSRCGWFMRRRPRRMPCSASSSGGACREE